jgi:hypothetical protein
MLTVKAARAVPALPRRRFNRRSRPRERRPKSRAGKSGGWKCPLSLPGRREAMHDWTWGNDTPVWLTPRRTVYFIYRRAEGGGTEYLRDKRGRLRIWRSPEAVKAALARLTHMPAPLVGGLG